MAFRFKYPARSGPAVMSVSQTMLMTMISKTSARSIPISAETTPRDNTTDNCPVVDWAAHSSCWS